MEDRALVKPGAGEAAVASVTGCHGVLEVFLVALDIDASAVGNPPVSAVGTLDPFLPAHIEARRPTGHGIRPPEMLAYRYIADSDRPAVSFGVSTQALRTGATPVRPFVGPPATCVSLWEIPGYGAVLAFEALRDGSSRLIGRRTDPLQDRDGDGFGPAVDGFLSPFGLSAVSSLEDLFPGINRMMPAPTTYRSLRELVVHRHRGVGDREVVEGLVVEVVSSGGDRVRDLVDATATGPLARAAAHAWGVVWGWDRVRLVDVPARPGAALAVREDSGAVLFDLEAASVDSHYTGGIGEMIFGLLPWVAMRASCSSDFWRVLDHLRDHELLTGDRLAEALDDVAAVQARKMERSLLRKESIHDDRFHSWTQPTQLRSVLVRRVADDMAALDDEIAGAVEVIEHATARSAELRGQRHSRLTRGWSAAAAAIAVVALFAALAAVPGVSEPTLFPHWVHALSVTLALTATTIVVAVLWRRQ
ncbi:hypothetical protein [Rhodococcus yananensis]|uniref:hypothetical protein n=1 Tax=Rhodococcus yananensis TaxID=2879464 RepID=UPI003EBB6E05